MKKKLLLSVMALVMTVMPASAMTHVPYTTYTYSNAGEPQESPHAYIPAFSVAAADGVAFSAPSDVVTDGQNRLYIADTGNNRIVVMSGDGACLRVLSAFEHRGKADRLSAPKGVFVGADGAIYVSDTGNQRIVCFTADFQVTRMISRPESPLLGDYIFSPGSLAVDKVGRLYVCAENVNMGIMVLNHEGAFQSFFGSQKVAVNPLELFWRQFMTDEQIERTESFVPTEYDSVVMDRDGFIFATSTAVNPSGQLAAILSRSASTQYAPVKRFGAAGKDILKRQGYFPPAGDVSVSASEGGPSKIIDCAPGRFGSYVLADNLRGKLFLYNNAGELLYAFGGPGSQLGLFEGLCAVTCLSDGRIACLDSITNSLTVYTPTDYGNRLFEVMRLHEEHRYSEEIALWESLLRKNNNLDVAYTGLGKALMKKGEYREAMALFRAASNRAQYSLAYKEWRKERMSGVMVLIPVLAIAALVGVSWAFARIKKYNMARVGLGGKRTLTEQVMFGFYTMFHPFDGYWDLYHEKRGGLGAGLIILAGTCLSLGLKSSTAGYLYADENGSFWSAPLVLIAAVSLFVISNWCITSLTDGKGTAVQLLTMTCYSLMPLFLLNLPQMLLSHFLLLEESAYITILTYAAYGWVLFSMFVGILVVHQYTLPKGILTVFLTVVGMTVIVFLSLMFFNLLEPMIMFFVNYYKEILFRF